MSRHYDEVRSYSDVEIQDALNQSDVYALQTIVIGAALHNDNNRHVEQLCYALAKYPQEQIRGNAILGLGHLARRFGSLEEDEARPIVEAGLKDASEYVRGQAWAAADDITHYLGWTIDGFDGEV